MSNVVVLQAIIVCLGFLMYYTFRRKTPKNLPPGPKGLPFVGNILDLPPSGVAECLHWIKHKDIYGPISSVTALGQTIIIVHDRQIAQEILEKKAIKSSGRPVFEFLYLCGYSKFLVMAQLGERFKNCRKLFHQTIGSKDSVAKYARVQEVEARRLLLRVMKKPERILHHFKTEAASLILKIVYGYTVEPHKPDPLVALIDSMMTNFSRACVPFTQIVGFLPVLKHFPDGFPGTGFRETARQYADEINVICNVTYGFARNQILTRNNTESFVARSIQECTTGDAKEPNAEDVELIKWTAADLYTGASDTTVSSLISFIRAMTLFPEAQRKAQAEIDAVTGGNRLPTLEDRESMPYIEALVSEALRWFPVAPMAIGHQLTEDLTYDGYDLPKGAIVLPSTWWFTHDPAVYADPDSFTPERFLAPRHEPDPRTVVFGYGRRICPGRYLADSSIFLTLSHILAVFHISKTTDEQGKEIEPPFGIMPGIVAKPKEFPYRIVPRSEKHAEMIRNIEREHPWEESNSNDLGDIPQLAQVNA